MKKKHPWQLRILLRLLLAPVSALIGGGIGVLWPRWGAFTLLLAAPLWFVFYRAWAWTIEVSWDGWSDREDIEVLMEREIREIEKGRK